MVNHTEDHDDDYNSASDEDFNPEAPATVEDDADSSSDEEETETRSSKKRQRVHVEEPDDFDNSGDEATIQTGLKKKRKTKSKHTKDEEDEGGEGGLVKTRAQRRAEIQEKKPMAQAANSTVDVETLFAQMSGAKPDRSQSNTASTTSAVSEIPAVSDGTSNHASEVAAVPSNRPQIPPLQADSSTPAAPSEEMITIKRKYDFAGQIIEEELNVPKESAQARRYLEEQAQQQKNDQSKTTQKPPLRRPMKKSSIFDAAPDDSSSIPKPPSKAHKLNTLEKSKLDWAAHVDQEGISEELDVYHKGKSTYLGRMDFLDRTARR